MLEHSQKIKEMCIELPWTYAYTEKAFRLFLEVFNRTPNSTKELMETTIYLPLIKAEKTEKALKETKEYFDKVFS